MNGLRLVGEELKGSMGLLMDISKVVIATGRAGINGAQLDQMPGRGTTWRWRCAAGYATAITSVFDSGEGLLRLERALMEIDGECAKRQDGGRIWKACGERNGWSLRAPKPYVHRGRYGRETEQVELAGSCGCVSGEYIYVYPPGIPIVAPGRKPAGRSSVW